MTPEREKENEAWKQRDEARVQLGDAHLEIGKLREKLKVAEEALKFCKDYDRSPEPEYGETVRGHKPGVGQRFLTPKEKARITLEALSKIRGSNEKEKNKLKALGALNQREIEFEQDNARLRRERDDLRIQLKAVIDAATKDAKNHSDWVMAHNELREKLAVAEEEIDRLRHENTDLRLQNDTSDYVKEIRHERDCVLKQNAELHRTLNNLREKLAAVEKEINLFWNYSRRSEVRNEMP